MNTNQNCTLPNTYSNDQSRRLKLKKLVTKFLTRIKICNAEELSRLK